MTADTEHEAAFIRAFIIAAKQERFVELLAQPKRRRDVLGTLYHFKDLDQRFISRIPAAEDSAAGIEALLRSKGAPDLCYAISTDSDLDGRTVTLRAALTRIHGLGHGTLLSCVPGSLGYFEGEEIGERYVLERRGAVAIPASHHRATFAGDTAPSRPQRVDLRVHRSKVTIRTSPTIQIH